jgi:hypothetical protein
MDFPDKTNRILGGSESQVVVGAAVFTVLNDMKGYALTVRQTGTIISAISVQDNDGGVRSYVPTWLGISLNEGEYLRSLFPIVSITLTAVADSITLHCDKSY